MATLHRMTLRVAMMGALTALLLASGCEQEPEQEQVQQNDKPRHEPIDAIARDSKDDAERDVESNDDLAMSDEENALDEEWDDDSDAEFGFDRDHADTDSTWFVRLTSHDGYAAIDAKKLLVVFADIPFGTGGGGGGTIPVADVDNFGGLREGRMMGGSFSLGGLSQGASNFVRVATSYENSVATFKIDPTIGNKETFSITDGGTKVKFNDQTFDVGDEKLVLIIKNGKATAASTPTRETK